MPHYFSESLPNLDRGLLIFYVRLVGGPQIAFLS